MQGDLDNPPIVIATSRKLNYGGLVVCAAGLLYGAWQLPAAHGISATNITFGLALLGLGFFYFGWQSISPSTLVIAPDGVTWGNTWVKRHWAWTAIGNFRPVPMGGVGCDLYDANPRMSLLRKLNKRSGGSHGALGFGWEGGSEKVVAILQTAQARWR